MTYQLRSVTRWHLTASGALWLAVALVLGFAQFLVARACGYELGALGAYGAYFALHVVLPGIVVLHLVNRARLSLTAAVALGVPTGFAIEIISFLVAAAMGAKPWLPFAPVAWLVIAGALWRRRGEFFVQVDAKSCRPAVVLALSILFLCTVVMAVSQMFAESPLVSGLPQRPIFHDWVFLVSRAAAIKNHWPLEDPSLAGTILQYHYFMLVHAAAASLVTKLELSLVLLRLMIIPLGAVLVVQAYALGRMLSRSAWGGVTAAFLTVAASELSLVSDYQQMMFLGLFGRWLYVSPTFFFGMVFFGALLLAVAGTFSRPGWNMRQFAWLMLLVAAGTGAKGTVLPVVLLAAGFWALWRMARERRMPWRLIAFGAAGTGAFGFVYYVTMARWGTGAAAFAPFDVFQLSDFWQQHFTPLQDWLGREFPAPLNSRLATLLCATAIFAGTSGIRLLAIPYLLTNDDRETAPTRQWLGAVVLASLGMGACMELKNDGELYLFLLARLPMAVLASAYLVEVFTHFKSHQAQWLSAATGWRGVAGVAVPALALIGAVCTAGVQAGAWAIRNEKGFLTWARAEPGTGPIDVDMLHLREALLWVRANTEPDAVLVTNTCTAANLEKDHWSKVDRTLAGVHFYYSALSERRVLVEGPRYLLDTEEVIRRVQLADEIFFADRLPLPSAVGASTWYAMIDRSTADGAAVALHPDARVFKNERIEVYRFTANLESPSPSAAVAVTNR